LSSGAIIADKSEEAGIGGGVKHLVKGLEDEVDTDAFDIVEPVELVLSVLA
jgi:hypothetical protein